MNNKRIVRQVSSNVTTHTRYTSISRGQSHRHVDPEENMSQVSTISPTRQRNPLDSFFNRKREISLSDVGDVFLIRFMDDLMDVLDWYSIHALSLSTSYKWSIIICNQQVINSFEIALLRFFIERDRKILCKKIKFGFTKRILL